jgi:hypothetical protein
MAYALCRKFAPMMMHETSRLFRKFIWDNPFAVKNISTSRTENESIDSTLEECLCVIYTNYWLSQYSINLKKQQDLRLLTVFKCFGDKRYLWFERLRTGCIDFGDPDVRYGIEMLGTKVLEFIHESSHGDDHEKCVIKNLHKIPNKTVKTLHFLREAQDIQIFREPNMKDGIRSKG